MTVFNSKINTNSEGFQKNRADMLALVERLQGLNARGAAISGKKKSRFEARGQLLPRERLARLLDPGMPFLEIGNLLIVEHPTSDIFTNQLPHYLSSAIAIT